MDDDPAFFLEVRVGRLRRHTTANAKDASRTIEITECPIIRCDDSQIAGKNIYDQQLDFWIREVREGELPWDKNPEKIGAFSTSRFHVNLLLHPQAFSQFWHASEAADGAARNIRIDFKKDHPEIFAIVEACLSEYMPDAIDFEPQSHAPGFLPGRAHPVVSELRIMRAKLLNILRPLAIGMAIILIISLAASVIRSFK